MRSSILWCLAAALGLAGHSPLIAQTDWQRLESRIRAQTEREKPAEAPLNGPEVIPPQTTPPAVAAAASAEKPYLGIFADDHTDRGRGVRVLNVTPGGPADKAGLKTQDLITAMADVRVRQMSELADILDLYAPGDKVKVEILRGDQVKHLELVFGRKSNAAPAAASNMPAPPGQTPPAQPSERSPLVPPKPLAEPPQKPELPAPLPGAPALTAPGPVALPRPPQSLPQTREEMLEKRIADLEHRVEQLEHRLEKKREP